MRYFDWFNHLLTGAAIQRAVYNPSRWTVTFALVFVAWDLFNLGRQGE